MIFNLFNGFQLHNKGHYTRDNKFKLFKNEALHDIKKCSSANRVVMELSA